MKKSINVIIIALCMFALCACTANVTGIPAQDGSAVDEGSSSVDGASEDEISEKTQDEKDEDSSSENDEEKKDENSTESEDEKAETENENSEADMSGVANNNAYFIGVDGKVYFRAHNEKSLSKSVLWDNFLSSPCGESSLYSYDVKTGKLEELCTFENAVGELFYFENNIISRSRDKKGEETLSAYSLDKGELLDNMDLGAEHFAGVSDNGRYMITYDWLYNGEPAYLHVYSNMNHVIGDYETETFSGIIGMKDDILFYEYYERKNEEDAFEEGYYGIMQLNVRTGETVDLGTFPEVSYGSGEFDQVLITDDKLYVCYGIYDGTGHFYQNGYLVSAVIGQKNSAESRPFDDASETNNYFDKSPVVGVDESGECIIIGGIPFTTALKDKNIGFFDEKGEYLEIAKEYGWIENNDEDESVVSTEQSEYLYGKLFVIRDYLDRNSSEDIGWRYAYKRSGFEVISIDTDTKKEDVLLTVGTN